MYVEKAISDFPSEYHDYLELMAKFPREVVMSGSSVLQIILGVTYDGSDIDIYVYSGSTNLHDIVVEFCIITDLDVPNTHTFYSGMNSIVNVISGYRDGRKVDLVITNDHPIQHIMCDFDIHILKNFVTSTESNSFTLFTDDSAYTMESLYDWPMIIQDYRSNQLAKSINRISKYINRGIRLFILDPTDGEKIYLTDKVVDMLHLMLKDHQPSVEIMVYICKMQTVLNLLKGP